MLWCVFDRRCNLYRVFTQYDEKFYFTTALPPGTLGAVQKAIEIVKEDNERRERLIENGAYFRNHLREAGFDIEIAQLTLYRS